MARYSISELYNYKQENWHGAPELRPSLMFGFSYMPPQSATPDERPEFIKNYVDRRADADNEISRRYADWYLCYDCDNIDTAFNYFVADNVLYIKMHMSELLKVEGAFNSEFNPIENYDRVEETTVNTDMTNGTTSKVAPDDTETFFNVGNADSTTSGDVTTTSHIHGNIGVTQATEMIRNTIDLYGNNAMYDYLISKLIANNCFLVC